MATDKPRAGMKKGMAPSTRYFKPPTLRREAAMGAGPANIVVVRDIEVVQTVQDLAHSVPLIAGRTTVVRLYVDPTTVSRATRITAEIAWSRDGAESYLAALNDVPVGPQQGATLGQQRDDAARSINFRLPPEAVLDGDLTLRISRIVEPGRADLAIGQPTTRSVRFTTAGPLRIRVIGLRYAGANGAVAPAAVHFSYLRSFLGRAYPASAVEWSHIVVDADFAPPFDAMTPDLANAQLAAIRAREVAAGTDPRTHYYGLVDDDSSRNFMRGKAFAIPSGPQPDAVASGPAGVPNGFAGDQDMSYADWYGAHELGHTFGRFHPGFPPGSQDASDPAFPYADGLISPPTGQYVGFDVGDSELALPMRALPGSSYHDIMTYADNQWVSAYTFAAILHRLAEEEALI